MLAQTHLSRRVSEGHLNLFGKLKAIQMQINTWFDNEAEKVKLHARFQDIQDSEKVRIYHHEILYRTINKSTIQKLKTPNGIIQGHDKCAAFLNEESKALLETEVELDDAAQNLLLASVPPAFDEKDNAMLEAEITDEEIKASLNSSNKNASPGADGLTFQTYVQCWSTLGPHLCQVLREVVKSGSPSKSMSHAYQVFSPKIGKASSILPKDKRRLALLQSDYKVLTGVLAARLRKTEGHTLSTHHPASRVTLWVSHGKFASRTSFQGGLFFFRGAIFFLQGGLFFWHEKWKFTFRGALAPLKENCILSSKLVI